MAFDLGSPVNQALVERVRTGKWTRDVVYDFIADEDRTKLTLYVIVDGEVYGVPLTKDDARVLCAHLVMTS